ncbi:MAG: EAL domain-containing protein [Lachnospiraceae bacterium]|nr:EAL domain-containing protein [Lachnospiraceae bacterium]
MFVQQLYTYGIYNVSYNICAILLSLLMLFTYLIRGRLNRLADRTILAITILMVVGCTSETVILFMRNNPALLNPGLCSVLTLIYHVAYNAEPYCMLIYLYALSRIDHSYPRALVFWMSFPTIAMVICLLIPSVRHLIYFYDPAPGSAIIHHGPLYFIFYLVTLIYAVSMLIFFIRFRKTFGRRLLPAAIFTAISFLTIFVNQISPYLEASRFLQTLCILAVSITFIQDEPGKDVITGLYNRHALFDDVRTVFNTESHAALIVVKIVNLPYYRSILPVPRISSLLGEVGNWLKSNYADNYTYVYSTENGTFVLLNYLADREAMIEKAENIRKSFPSIWADDNTQLSARAQVWLAFLPDMISTVNQLDMLVNSPVSSRPDSRRIYFADEMKTEARRVAIEQAINRNLKSGSLKVYYQPIYDTKRGRIRSAEALIRMNDSELGYVSPEEFIKVAEGNETIHEIGSFIMNDVCRFLSEKHPERFGLDFIEINVSAIQCMDWSLADKFQKALDQYHVDPSLINLEITESAFAMDSGIMNQVIHRLKIMGFTLSMDDFGTGYSNYTKMVEIPFDIVKIDKSILWSVRNRPENEPILRCSVEMCKELGREVLVEGVESQEQKDLLIQSGVDYLQGYFYSKPVSEDEFLDYLKNGGQID